MKKQAKKKKHVKYPNLARFLSDHFGAYESAQAAADQEYDGDVNAYVEDFIGESLKTGDLKAVLQDCEKFLGENPDFEKLRKDKDFEDTGNPKRTLAEIIKSPGRPGEDFLYRVIWLWN